MRDRARARRPRLRGLASLLLCALLAGGAPGEEAPGDVFLTLENDDARGDRFAGELLWVQPTLPWLALELGGRYAEFDAASWGYGIAGASVRLPAGLGFAALHYEGGAGQGESGHFGHQIGELSFTRALWPKRVFIDAGFQLIRVGEVDDELGKLGLTLAPRDDLQVRGGYLRSVFNGRDTDGWTVVTTWRLRGASLAAGYARSHDTVDLRSLGRGRVRGDPADEYSAALTLPLAPHGITLAATRYEGPEDTRHTLRFTYRWSLSAPPWRLGGRDESVALGAPR